MVATRRELHRQATGDEIKLVARRQIGEHGAAALSLRAIAAEMGMTAPALYRYYPSRDDLVTALIVDAFCALGEAMEAGQSAVPESDYRGRFLSAALAYRSWAVNHRAEFDLIFGTPIPGYHAPPEVTVPVVRRTFRVLLSIPADAWTVGRLDPTAPTSAAMTDDRLLAYLSAEGVPLPPAAMRVLLEGWAAMHGMVTLELLGHLPPIIGDAAEFYEAAIRAFTDRIGFRSSD